MDENLVSQHALACACSDMMQAGTGRHARGEPPAVGGAGSMYQGSSVRVCMMLTSFIPALAYIYIAHQLFPPPPLSFRSI